MKKFIFALPLFFLAATALADANALHKFGRKDPVNLLGAKVYDSTGPLQCGGTGTSTHSEAAGDVLVPNNFEVQGTGWFNGVAWNASGQMKDAMLAQAQNANLNITSKQTLYTCPSTKTHCYVSSIWLTGASGTSTTAQCGVGWDTNATNVHASATHAITNSTYMKLAPVTVATAGNPNDVLGLKCGTPEGSALTATVTVFGYAE